MSSTEHKRFIQTRTSTAAERRAYRIASRAAKTAYWKTPEGLAFIEQVAQAHREYMASQMDTPKSEPRRTFI